MVWDVRKTLCVVKRFKVELELCNYHGSSQKLTLFFFCFFFIPWQLTLNVELRICCSVTEAKGRISIKLCIVIKLFQLEIRKMENQKTRHIQLKVRTLNIPAKKKKGNYDRTKELFLLVWYLKLAAPRLNCATAEIIPLDRLRGLVLLSCMHETAMPRNTAATKATRQEGTVGLRFAAQTPGVCFFP